VKLNYFSIDCADGSHVAVNYTLREDRLSGSARRWSPDRKVNFGRRLEAARDDLERGPDGAFRLRIDGICAEPILVPLDGRAVREAGWTADRAA
jgi:hypothetical protein